MKRAQRLPLLYRLINSPRTLKMNKEKEKAHFLVNGKKFYSVIDALKYQENESKVSKITFVPANIKTILLS